MERAIINAIGEPAVLEQLAEECAELGHAALKLARFLRGENHTPVSKEQALNSLFEETADVRVCLTVLEELHDEFVNTDYLEDMKMDRWVRRVTDGKVCQSCIWHEEFNSVCTNGDSEDCADLVNPLHSCRCWEGHKPACKGGADV